MALFNFGKSDATGSEGGRTRRRRRQADEPQETLETIRRRARNRLLGAALLVGVTVIGLPMLFDRQPRVVNVDAQVSIPDKNDVAPLQVPVKESLDAREEFVQSAETPPMPTAVPMPDAPPQAAAPEPAPQPAKTAEVRDKERKEQQAKADKERKEQQPKAEKERKEQQAAKAKAEKERKEQQAKAEKERKELQAKAEKERKERERKEANAARARDLLEGKTTASAPKQRFIIPIGAFADAQAARETRMKAERAGVHTYIQIIKTREGEERTRVRAGPYTSREEADKAAATLKGLGLPSAVQTL